MKITDDTIIENVVAELAADDNLDESTIAVSATDGIVHLSGTVPTHTDHGDAERVAKHAVGVRGVVNELQVVSPLTEV